MIGVFDSGFGGLTILRDIVARLPQYSYVYLGDTARAPYGDRDKKDVYEFTKQAVDFLFKEGCELIILACNTTSSEALRRIQQEYLPRKYRGKNVLGVIVPTAEVAAHETKSGVVGVIGTTGTIKSGAFIEELHKEDPALEVVQHACPALVPLIESGEHSAKEMQSAVQECVTPIQESEADTLIIGCTHYGLIQSEIQNTVGRSIKVISEGAIIAEKLENYLARHKEMEEKIVCGRNVQFFTTGNVEKFRELGSQFYGSLIEPTEVELGRV